MFVILLPSYENEDENENKNKNMDIVG